MTISVTPGTQRTVVGSQSIEQLTQSTATAAQALSAQTYVSVLGAGTATGTLSRNQYTMPEGPDGLMKLIILAATGEATLQMTMATGMHYIGRDVAGAATATNIAGAVIGAATGALVLNSVGDFVHGFYANGGWTILGSNATYATAT